MLELHEGPVDDLHEHAGIASEFEAMSVYDVRRESGACELVERALAQPLRKNYDLLEDPVGWGRALDGTPNVLISVRFQGVHVGGIIVAVARAGLVAWPAARGAAIVWDLRVARSYRRSCVGSSLLCAAESWARRQGCAHLEVETQNTNVAACRFYVRNGFALCCARDAAYPDVPGDVQLIWRKGLDA